jgi:hydroxymethylpyrimidine pyrophosphatase-like HAD family hydrolase
MAAIIVDIDDTLLRNGVQPMRSTIDWINERAKNYTIIIVTGRPESTRDRTVRALKDAGIKYNRLLMNTGSTRQSNQFKGETAKRIKSQVRVVLAIDNDEGARSAYRNAGIKTASPSSLGDSILKYNMFWRL